MFEVSENVQVGTCAMAVGTRLGETETRQSSVWAFCFKSPRAETGFVNCQSCNQDSGKLVDGFLAWIITLHHGLRRGGVRGTDRGVRTGS